MATLSKLHTLDKEGREIRVDDYYFDPKTDIIYFVKRMDGKLVRFSTGVKRPNIRKAKEHANLKLRGKINNQTTVKMLIGELMHQYIEASEVEARRGEISQRTVIKRRQIMRKLRPFWENMRAEELTAENWLKYIDWYEENYPGERLFDVRKYMRHFARHLNQKTVNGKPVLLALPIFKNPFSKQEKKARAKKKSRIFTKEEIQMLLTHAPKREKLIILLAYTLALRINEVCTLKWSNLDLENGVYSFGAEDNKAGHEGTQAIHPNVVCALKAWGKAGPYVFPQASDQSKPLRPQMIDWASLKKASGVTWNWSAHTFRHTCLTELFTNPKYSHAAIMKCYRISFKVAVEHYIHIDEKTRDSLREAIDPWGKS